MATDYYDLLGVTRRATTDEIKRAYRQRARQLHPDANPGDAEAEAKFKQVAAAYEVLSNPERRQRYDQFGPEGPGGQGANGFGGGIGDIFDAFFGGGSPFGGGGRSQGGGPPRGSDIEVVLELEFEEAVFGSSQSVQLRAPVPCDTCEATGAAPGTSAITCVECGGAGQVRRVRQSILGQMVTAGACPRCHGMGQVIADPCPDCRGEGRRTVEKSYNVEVPAGVDTGSTLRLTGRGAAGPRGGGTGDLYVHLKVRRHERFVRQDYDLVGAIEVSIAQAALGTMQAFATLDGEEELAISPGTQHGRVFRLRGRGVPHVDGHGRGDLLVQVSVEVPTKLSKAQEDLLRRYADERGEAVGVPESGLLSKFRSAFK